MKEREGGGGWLVGMAEEEWSGRATNQTKVLCLFLAIMPYHYHYHEYSMMPCQKQKKDKRINHETEIKKSDSLKDATCTLTYEHMPTLKYTLKLPFESPLPKDITICMYRKVLLCQPCLPNSLQ